MKSANDRSIGRTAFILTAILAALAIPLLAMELKDGVYVGKATGYSKTCDIKVKVTVKGGRIEDVKIEECKDNRPLDALKVIPQRIVAKQGTEGVDAVTGSTYTSKGIIEAVRRALKADALDGGKTKLPPPDISNAKNSARH